MRSKIRLEDHGHCAWLVVDRPEAKNAIDLETMGQFETMIDDLAKRDDLVLLGIRGANDVFIAGGDIKDLASIKDAESAAKMSRQMNEILVRLGQLDCLSVAAINGDAYGGGCELALACDVRVISNLAKLYFKQAEMGLTPGWGGGVRLARVERPCCTRPVPHYVRPKRSLWAWWILSSRTLRDGSWSGQSACEIFHRSRFDTRKVRYAIVWNAIKRLLLLMKPISFQSAGPLKHTMRRLTGS